MVFWVSPHRKKCKSGCPEGQSETSVGLFSMHHWARPVRSSFCLLNYKKRDRLATVSFLLLENQILLQQQIQDTAHKNGCKFDGWNEYFDFEAWKKSFEECGVDATFYNQRKRSFDEILPWDHIDVGVSKAFLEKEARLAYEEKLTPNCSEQCLGCGAACFKGGICVER